MSGEQDEIADKYDVDRFNRVHLWLGVNFSEEEDYLKYFETVMLFFWSLCSGTQLIECSALPLNGW
jgi:hypothetical protein